MVRYLHLWLPSAASSKDSMESSLPFIDTLPWLFMRDLNELSNPNEKLSASKGNSSNFLNRGRKYLPISNFQFFLMKNYLLPIGNSSNYLLNELPIAVWGMREGQRLPIQFNGRGQPIGSNSASWTSFLLL